MLPGFLCCTQYSLWGSLSVKTHNLDAQKNEDLAINTLKAQLLAAVEGEQDSCIEAFTDNYGCVGLLSFDCLVGSIGDSCGRSSARSCSQEAIVMVLSMKSHFLTIVWTRYDAWRIQGSKRTELERVCYVFVVGVANPSHPAIVQILFPRHDQEY